VVSRNNPLFLVLTGIGLIGLVASFHGILIAGSRALLELGRAGNVPRRLGVIDPRTQTPVAALVLNMVVGLITLATGQTGSIILIAVFGALTLYVVSSAAVIRLRRSEPDLPRPYRAPGYPATAIIAFVLAQVCLGAMVWSYPVLAGIYAGILGLAWVLFVAFVPPQNRTTF
jgi:ethanolamine permease